MLHGCQLQAANPAVLASAVATVTTVDLTEGKLLPQQVVELLQGAAKAKALKYLTLDGVGVPRQLVEGDQLLASIRERYNVYTEAMGGRGRLLTSVIQ